MESVQDLARRALAFAEGIDVTADGGLPALPRRYIARLAGTAGPNTLAAARAHLLEQARHEKPSIPVIAAALLDEAARAWD